MNSPQEQISSNLDRVQRRLSRALRDAGRPEDACQLIAVSKSQPTERIRAALQAGHRLFGENRVQEAELHWADLRGKYANLRLHLIGGLQTNKVRHAVALFNVIETLDRARLARALRRELDKQERSLEIFIQVNTGEEPQKGGVVPGELEALLDLAREELALPVTGLMCIPPFEEPAAPHFALLAKLARRHGLTELSMGMTSDFEDAARLGATYVRVGTGVFGPRDQNRPGAA